MNLLNGDFSFNMLTCSLLQVFRSVQTIYSLQADSNLPVLGALSLVRLALQRNTRGKKISKWQETINRKNSKLRVRVEHVFGFMEECLHGMYSRVVGFARNAAFNTLTNLVYNLCRYEQVMRLGMN